MDELTGKVAVVTGAGRGIGRCEAVALAAAGARVVVNDNGSDPAGNGRDPGPADETVDLIKRAGGEAVADHGDVSVMSDAAALVRCALDSFGRLDIVVNNAGNMRGARIAECAEEDFDALVATHLRGTWCVSRHAARVFTGQRSGRLINTSSEAGLGMIGFGAYGAAKEGIAGLTRTLHLELFRHGVTVNTIRPRASTRLFTTTLQAGSDMGEVIGESLPDVAEAGILDGDTGFGPELVAPLVVRLCGDAAAHVSGREFVVGAGMVALLAPPVIGREVALDEVGSLLADI